MKTKLEMAHEFSMELVGNPTTPLKDMNSIMEASWRYADAMQAEADKREKEEQEKLKQDQQNHHDELVSIGLEEWQPNWDELPSNANYFAMDKSGMCNAYENKPEICDDQWDFGDAICECDSFGYKGDWRDSLRKRPE